MFNIICSHYGYGLLLLLLFTSNNRVELSLDEIEKSRRTISSRNKIILTVNNNFQGKPPKFLHTILYLHVD